MCYAGSRAHDYARRIAGESYIDIAKKGGGILSTVQHTRDASERELNQIREYIINNPLKRELDSEPPDNIKEKGHGQPIRIYVPQAHWRQNKRES